MATAEDAFGPSTAGLDRGLMDKYVHVDAKERPTPSEDFPNDAGTQGHITTDDRPDPDTNTARRLSRKIRDKLHIKRKSLTSTVTRDYDGDLHPAAPTLAPNPPTTSEKEDRFSEPPAPKSTMPPAKDFFLKPLSTAQNLAATHGGSDAAESLTKAAETHEANVKIVRAYEKIAHTANEDDEALARKDLELLKKARQDNFVRWTLDRHVHEVGRLEARADSEAATNESLAADEHDRTVNGWIGQGKHVLLTNLHRHGAQYIDTARCPPEPSQTAIMSGVERFVLISTPLQHGFLRLRDIAHWKNSVATGAYMGTYSILWWYNLIPSAIVLLLLALVVQRRLDPPSIPDLRHHLEKSEDKDANASDLTQFVDQHGGQGWVDAFIEKAGPAMQLQIQDWADIMEMVLNFYEWRDPARTMFSVGMLAAVWLIVTFVPQWLLIKGFFLWSGVMFFGLMPTAHHFRPYRRFTSPYIWMFWKIPTHAEWAIARLQAEAGQKLDIMRREEKHDIDNGVGTRPIASKQQTALVPSTDSGLPDSDASKNPLKLGRYRCMSLKHQGHLCLDTVGVAFVTLTTSTIRWSVKFEDMSSMRKIVDKFGLQDTEDILFTNNAGVDFQASNVKDRDVVFSQIIGYSGVSWQRTG